MKTEDFITQLTANFAKGMELIKAKNKDYAGEGDPFKNFRSASIADVSVPRAILVRILDKLARISNLLDREAAVKDEKIEDTILDFINYGNILLVYLSTVSKNQGHEDR